MVRIEENQSLVTFLEELTKIPEDKKEKLLSELGDIAKSSVEKNLTRSNIDDEGHVHMQDDVKKRMITDKLYGGKMVSVGGGKKTGTKWHLLNDGTYKTKPIHFIDKAMNELDSQAEGIIDNYLKGLGE